MTRRKKLLILVAIVPPLLLTAFFLYLNFADLSGWRDTVSEILSENMGRELNIDGAFEPDIGLTTSVTIRDITLANADWSSELMMVRIDRLAFEVDLLSLLSGPIRIHSLEIDGAEILLEVADDGRGNWEFEDDGDEDDGEDLDLRLARLAVNDLQIGYHDAASGESLSILLTRLESVGDDNDMHELALDGRFADHDLGVAGRLGTLSGLLNSFAIEHDLTGHLGGIEFASAGRIADLTTLGGADLTARVHGEDLAEVGEAFHLAGIGSGDFSADIGVKPAADGFEIDLGASAGSINADVSGSVDSLIQPKMVELLTVLNPFAGKDEATELQCAVLAVGLEDGLAQLDPLVIQTNRMTMLGKGSINLGTEELGLEWVTKPRKGIGLSASMITNPYIKLGGTLSNPSIQLKELQAVASTGAAVATLGLSFVAKGMLDRVTAEKKVCQQALEKIGRPQGKKPKKTKKKR